MEFLLPLPFLSCRPSGILVAAPKRSPPYHRPAPEIFDSLQRSLCESCTREGGPAEPCRFPGPPFTIVGGESLDVDFQRLIQILRDIFPILFPLTDTFGQKIFDLPVHGTEIIFCPLGNFIVKALREPQRDLFFGLSLFRCIFFQNVSHLFSGFSRWYRYLQSAVHPCFHTTRQVDCSPWRLSVPHPVRQSRFRLIYPTPSAPCRQRLPRSSDVHR